MPDEIIKIKSIKDIESILVHFFPIFFKKGNYLRIFSSCIYRIPRNLNKKVFNKYIKLNDDYFETKFLLKRGLKIFSYKKYSYFINLYSGNIEMEKLTKYSPQNLYTIAFKYQEEEILLPALYNIIHLDKNRGHNSKVYKINNYDLVCYFRQANRNSLAITVRKPNITDSFEKRGLIFGARLISLLMPKSKRVLFYEKNSNKYEESAAYLFEKLVDEGYKNCYFIINKESRHVELIDPKYYKNIIWAHSFKHYLNFFRCKNFIASESLPHSIELRAANKYITKKINSKNYRFVFLQHGVMYMVSIDSRGRNLFRKGLEMPIDSKIVVSSQLEANHFIELGGFNQNDLYISGLPFYDRTIKKESADKITIMLTWRSWEYNILETDYKNANYYKMVLKILDNVPNEYKDKIMILPHPLILDKLATTDLKHLIPDILSYDKILEETALLITDYSSIAYSAFYRGANVIFCFEELEECMQQYGGHLMLNEKNIFGDISYDFKDLKTLVKNNYLKPQSKLYQKRYQQIVEFKDNKNTKRLIEILKRDKFI